MIDWHCTSEDIQAYVDGELDGAPLQLVEEHIDRCEGCARLAGRLLMLSQSLGAIPPHAAPVGLRERVMSAVARAEGVEALDCATSREMISAYLDDELTAAGRDRLEAHVFACGECYAHLRRTRGIVESLRVINPAATPADMHENILAAIERDARRTPMFTWRRIAMAAASVAAGVAIWMSTLVPTITTPPAPMIAAGPASPVVETPAPVTSDEIAPAVETADTVARVARVARVTTPRRTVSRGSAARATRVVAPTIMPADTLESVDAPPAITDIDAAPPVEATSVEEPVTVPAADLVVPAPVEHPTAIAVVSPPVRVSGPAVVDEPTVAIPAPPPPGPAPVVAVAIPAPQPTVRRHPEETVIAYRTEATRFEGSSEGRNADVYTRMADAINTRVGASEWMAESAGIQIH